MVVRWQSQLSNVSPKRNSHAPRLHRRPTRQTARQRIVGRVYAGLTLDGMAPRPTGRPKSFPADLARRSGEATTPSQIVREAAGFTRGMVLTADAELNIRDEKGIIRDFANFFRLGQVDRSTAEAGGLRASAPGRAGGAILRDDSATLVDLHAHRKIADSAATLRTTAALGNESLKQL